MKKDRRVAWQEKMIEAGRCRQCGAPSKGKSLCNECAIKAQASKFAWIKKMRAAGICVHCGYRVVASDGKSCCIECLCEAAARNAFRAEKRRAAGICVQCGAPSKGKRRCNQCAIKNYAYRKTRRAAGRCVQCGRSSNGKQLCIECTIKRQAWACFKVKDRDGCPAIYKACVVFWGLTKQGEPAGLIISTKSGLPEPARSFSNFIRYEYEVDCETWEAPR